jgi:hypothetical protein
MFALTEKGIPSNGLWELEAIRASESCAEISAPGSLCSIAKNVSVTFEAVRTTSEGVLPFWYESKMAEMS